MKISACYIVRNEEQTLGKSIDSLQGNYDELIVVDTGSTDGTVAVAEKYGAQIYHFVWQNDFSLARNFALAKAVGDWVVFLDADEYYEGPISIREYLQNIEKNSSRVDAVLIPLYEAHQRSNPPMLVIRFFRNKPDIRYQGAIHEQITKGEKSLNLVIAEEMIFIHTGYHPQKMAEKSQRNLQMLLADIAKNGEQPAYYYYIAECYFGMQEYEQAIVYIKKAIASPVRHYREEANYYHILLESMRQCNYPAGEMVPIAAEAIRKFPDMPEFYGEQGIILSSMGRLDEAFYNLNKCVEKYDLGNRQAQEYGYFNDEIMGIIYARLARIAIVQHNDDFARVSASLAQEISNGKWGKEEMAILKEELDKKREQLVVICIPIYKEKLTVYEQASLQQLNKILGKYPRVFIAPQSLDFDYGAISEGIRVERFPNHFFSGVQSYSALMLQKELYQRFADYRYMLLYQTDAFVFSDKLAEFCALDYDYIGAPVPMTGPVWHFIGGRVGNGGFSLRKISSALRMLNKWPSLAESPLANIFWQWEDVFWGYCSRQSDWNFKVPNIQTALSFAVQDNVSHVQIRMKNGWRPFGCHGWWQMDYEFWQPIIEACGYKFPSRQNPAKNRYPRLHDYLQSRNSLNIHYLWGLYNNGLYAKMIAVLDNWLANCSPEHKAWQYIMEKIICLWRVVEADKKMNHRQKISCQRRLSLALQYSLQHEVDYPVCWNMLVTMLPYLQRYDYVETNKLAKEISTAWWEMWSRGAHYADVQPKSGRRIAVLSKAVDEAEFVESFVRHTMTFADAIIMDISLATERVKKILSQLVDEGIALILHEKHICVEQVQDDVDFVIVLDVSEFLLPQRAQMSVGKCLAELNNKETYTVETGSYALYLPYAHKDKFLLSRPLVRQSKITTYKKIIYGCNARTDRKIHCEGVYLVQMEHIGPDSLKWGIIPVDMELVDISAFSSCPELKYMNWRNEPNRYIHTKFGGYLQNQLFMVDLGINVTARYYQQLHELLKITPVDDNFIRVGRHGDGGYLMLNYMQGGIAYSFGINDDVSWDTDMANYGYDVYMYDHTIDRLPLDNPNFHFHKCGLGIQKKETIQGHIDTLSYFLQSNRHEQAHDMVLKMDIEGAEWDVLSNIDERYLRQFSQIVIEYHGLLSANSNMADKKIFPALRKINNTHNLIHLHGNNMGTYVEWGNKVFPDALEATYVSKEKAMTLEADKDIVLPHRLDEPNDPNRQDIVLGRWNEPL